jgi:PAS domain S-box-containing protein
MRLGTKLLAVLLTAAVPPLAVVSFGISGPSGGGSVQASSPTDRGPSRGDQRVLAAVIATSALSIGAAWTLAERTIARPVRRVRDAARALSGADARAASEDARRVREERESDELAELVRAVEQASATLAARTSEGARATKELEGREARLRAIVDTAGDGILSLGASGRIESVNAVAERMFGYAQNELLGVGMAMLIAPLSESENSLQRWLESGEKRASVAVHEAFGLRKDGRTFPMFVALSESAIDGRRVFTAVVRDISAAKRGEAELRDQAARLRAIVETAGDGIVTIDAKGRIESANPAVELMFGFDRRDLVGQKVELLMPEPFRSEHDIYLERYLRTGEARIIGIGREVLGRRKDGSTFPLDLAVTEFALGERRMFAGILRDITTRKRAD